jgi:pimeloyl-ACP methyl ester carboxylesterase
MASLAADAITVADAAGLERFHLAGVSMGGMIAQHVALDYRARVRSLVLAATHPGGWPHRIPPAGALGLWTAMRHRDRGRRLDALAKLLFPAPYLAATDRDALHAALAQEFGGHVSLRALLGQIRAIAGHDTRARLAGLAGLPTLVLQPGEDRLVRPSGSTTLATALPGARLERLANAGHGLVRQCADEVNQMLADHWQASAAHP